MTKWISDLDLTLQVVIISSLTSLIVLILGWIIRALYERGSLRYKLKKEFEFEQKKKLKQDIAKNKIHLLNAIEELNHRLWNFNLYVGEGWHKISKNDWFKNDQYYINSFVYRILVFIHWTLKTEKDTVSVDSTIADKNDIKFLKYIKTLKEIFTAADLLRDLGYDRSSNTNHFYKNDLIGYCKWVVENGKVLDFDEFEIKLKYNYESLQKVIEYFTTIEDNISDRNLNVLRCTHLLAIQFLNDFGHSYQKTNKKKINRITNDYKTKIMIKDRFEKFIINSKLENEMKSILKKIK